MPQGNTANILKTQNEATYFIQTRASDSAALLHANDTEKKLQQEYLRQANSAITKGWNPFPIKAFMPRTELGKKLWAIKQQMILNGETTEDWNQVMSTINKARGIE